jgi:steroid 5-alpha reductase family enzyme
MTLLAGCLGAVVWMTLLYGVRRLTRNAGVVDVGWALGVGALTLALAGTGEGLPARRAMLACLAGFWSLRLGLYLLADRVVNAKEDGRYQALLASWGDRAERNLFLLYLAQAGFVVMFCIPFLPVVNSSVPVGTLWDGLSLCIWIAAVAGEALSDRQLARWRADPANRGRTCRRGLWRYSRHPNYFFEWLHWWTYVFLAVGAPRAWLALLGPAVMLLFLFRFTGIPYTEAQALKSRGEDYARYQRTTRAFFPWFPRHSG